MKKAICIGSATKDIFVSLKETKIIENPEDITSKRLMGLEFGAKIYADSYREAVGGSAVNVGQGMSLCDLRPFVFSRVSRSESGKWILKQIGKRGLKKNYVQKTGGVESEISVIVSDQTNKDHVILRTGDSVENFDVKKGLDSFREKVDLIYVGSQKKGWQEDFANIIEFAKKKKATLALNPSSFQISESSSNLIDFLSDVDVLLVNRDEAIEIIKNAGHDVQDEITFLAAQLLNKGCPIVVITDGVEGAYVAKGDKIFHVPSMVEEVVDTTGAGDAFAAGFLSSLTEEDNIERALLWGIFNSAGTISKKGATKGLLSKKELNSRIREASNLIKKIK